LFSGTIDGSFFQLHAPATLLQGNSPQYPLDRRLAVWTAQTVRMLWEQRCHCCKMEISS